MSQKSITLLSFVKYASLFITVIGTTVLTVNWGMDKLKDVVRTEIRPLVDRIEKLEDFKEEAEQLLAINTTNIQAVTVSVNSFVEYYNRVYHKEFLRPADISLTSERKRK